MNVEKRTCIRINAPEFFERDDFREFLSRSLDEDTAPLATWHTGGIPDGGSDVFVTYDNGEGSHAYPEGGDEVDANLIPQYVWDQICEALDQRDIDHGLLWISNLPE